MTQIIDLMSERNLWRYLQRNLCKKGLFSRIENPFYKGIPDVNYLMNGVEGWIELKYVKSFPKKELTPVSIPHYTKEQKMWYKVRYDAGGNTAIILQVDKYYFIFRQDKTALVGHLNYKALKKLADGWWVNKINFKELEQILCKKYN